MISLPCRIRMAEPIMLALVVLLAGVAVSDRARAFGCNCGVIASLHSQTRQHVTVEATEAARHIIEALRLQARQNSRHLDRQVEAERRMADGMAQNDARMLRSEFRARAESGLHDPNPDFCLIMDAALEPKLPEEISMPAARTVVRHATDWSFGRTRPVVENGVRMARWLADERDSIKNAGGAIDATTEWSTMLNRPTLELADPNTRQALTRLVANTVDPFPPKPLTEGQLKTPAGLSEAVRRRAAESRNQAAIAAIEAVLEIASPSEYAAPYRKIAERSRYDRSIPDIISELQALEIRAAAYHSPTAEALETRHAKTDRALLQDLIDLQSLNLRINHLRLVQEARSAIVLAAMLGLMTDGTVSSLSR